MKQAKSKEKERTGRGFATHAPAQRDKKESLSARERGEHGAWPPTPEKGRQPPKTTKNKGKQSAKATKLRGEAAPRPTRGQKNEPATFEKVAPSPSPFVEADGVLTTRALFTVEGVAILEWSASFPLPTTHGMPQKAKKGITRIADFYRRLAEESDRYARGGLLAALTRQYENDPDPRKRYRHARVRLSVTHTVTQAEGEFYSVLRTTTLSRAGKTIAVREEGEVFDRVRGRLCPLSRLRRAGLAPQRGEKEKTAKSGFYLQGGAICFPRTEIS